MWKFLAKLSVVSALVLVVAWFVKEATKTSYSHRSIFDEKKEVTGDEPADELVEEVECEDFFADIEA